MSLHEAEMEGRVDELEAEVERLEAEVDRLREELDRLTTLRPASEWDGETYVLWWREWDVAGWALDSISDVQVSLFWTPAFDVRFQRAGGCEPAHPIAALKEPK